MSAMKQSGDVSGASFASSAAAQPDVPRVHGSGPVRLKPSSALGVGRGAPRVARGRPPGPSPPPPIPYLKPKPRKKLLVKKFEAEKLGMSISKFLSTQAPVDEPGHVQHDAVEEEVQLNHDESIHVRSFSSNNALALGDDNVPPAPTIQPHFEPLQVEIPASLNQADFLEFIRRQQIQRAKLLANDEDPGSQATLIHPKLRFTAIDELAPGPPAPYLQYQDPFPPHEPADELDRATYWNPAYAAARAEDTADDITSMAPSASPVRLSPQRSTSPFHWTISPMRFILREPEFEPPPLSAIHSLEMAETNSPVASSRRRSSSPHSQQRRRRRSSSRPAPERDEPFGRERRPSGISISVSKPSTAALPLCTSPESEAPPAQLTEPALGPAAVLATMHSTPSSASSHEPSTRSADGSTSLSPAQWRSSGMELRPGSSDSDSVRGHDMRETKSFGADPVSTFDSEPPRFMSSILDGAPMMTALAVSGSESARSTATPISEGGSVLGSLSNASGRPAPVTASVDGLHARRAAEAAGASETLPALPATASAGSSPHLDHPGRLTPSPPPPMPKPAIHKRPPALARLAAELGSSGPGVPSGIRSAAGSTERIAGRPPHAPGRSPVVQIVETRSSSPSLPSVQPKPDALSRSTTPSPIGAGGAAALNRSLGFNVAQRGGTTPDLRTAASPDRFHPLHGTSSGRGLGSTHVHRGASSLHEPSERGSRVLAATTPGSSSSGIGATPTKGVSLAGSRQSHRSRSSQDDNSRLSASASVSSASRLGSEDGGYGISDSMLELAPTTDADGKEYNTIEDTSEDPGDADYVPVYPREYIVAQVLEWPGHFELHPLSFPHESEMYDAAGQLVDLPEFRDVEMACLVNPDLPSQDVSWDIWHLAETQRAPRAVTLFWMANSGRLDEALARINAELVSAAPAALLYLGAQLRVMCGKPEDALRDLEDVLAKDRNLVEAWALKARLHQLLGPSRLCINGYTHVLKLRPGPESWRIYYERGCMHEATKEPMYAFEDFKMVRAHNPACMDAVWRHVQYYLDKELYEDALSTIQVILDAHPNDARATFLRGAALAQLTHWGRALDDFTAAIRLDPAAPEPYVHRGCLARIVSPKRALEDLSVALLLDENNVDALLYRGHVYYTEGRYELAHSDWMRVSELAATAHLHLNLGILAMHHLDDYVQAMQHLDTALDMDPLLLKAYLARAELCQLLHHESFMVSGSIIRRLRKKNAGAVEVNFLERATREYSRAIRLYPRNYTLYLYRGRLLLRQKKTGLSMHDFHTAFELNSGIAQTFLQRSLILSFQGKYAQIIREFADQKAAGVRFEDNLLVLVAKAKMRTGDAEGALAILNESPNNSEPQLHLHRGLCYQSLRRYAQATNEYTRCVVLSPKFAKAYYHRGVCRLVSGDALGGLEDINEAIRQDPKMFEAYLTRASHYERQGRFNEGVEDCTTAIRLEPGSVRGYLYRGLLRCRLKQYPAALADFTRVTEIDRDCASAYLNRAITHHHAGELQSALRDYSIVLMIAGTKARPTRRTIGGISGGSPNASGSGGGTTAATGAAMDLSESINRSLSEDSSDEKQRSIALAAHRNRGFLHWQCGDYHAALCDLSEAAAGTPDDIPLHELLGLALFKVHRVPRAVEVFSQVIAAHPENVSGYLARGNVYAQTGRVQAAIGDYARCLHLQPRCVEAYVNLGYVTQRIGAPRRAWDHFTAALALDPNCTAALQGRASIHLARGDFFAALLDMTSAVTLDPNDANAMVNRGVVYQAMGDHVAALRDFKAAIALNPAVPLAHFNAANLYFAQQSWERARACYDAALALDADDYHALVNRALTCIELQDYGQAEMDLEHARQFAQSPEEAARVMYHLAILCQRQSQFAAAEAHLNKTLQLVPQAVDAWIKRAEIRGQLGKMTGALQDYAHAITLDSRLEPPSVKLRGKSAFNTSATMAKAPPPGDATVRDRGAGHVP
ncbi:hypothetical protein H9P43_001758 [Blastocladiella emersonii ATCC 22665]|nr:hypothetical protein H9P43_001758 [Blastocladiella emersonii ATCC 22665]